MKKSFYLLFAFLLLTSVFVTSPAKANDLPCQGTDPYTDCPVNSGTALPINSGIVYLLVTGVIVGSVALSKYKPNTVKA